MVVISIPVPAPKPTESALESATTLVCPATTIVVNVSCTMFGAEFVTVKVSVAESVVNITPVPATTVKVSAVESAVIVFCPFTTIDWNRFCEPDPV